MQDAAGPCSRPSLHSDPHTYFSWKRAQNERHNEAHAFDFPYRKRGLCLFVSLTGICHQAVKVALIESVLDDPVLLKFTLGKGFRNGSGDFTLALPELIRYPTAIMADRE
jgi:hypothetical protein